MTKEIKVVKYLPQNHQGDNVGKLLGLADSELQNVSDFAMTIGLQAKVDLATYGLTDWEDMLSIEKNPTATSKDRRELIKSKLRSYGQATKGMIKNVAEAFSGGEVAVFEHFGEYRFTVKFVGVIGVPSNMENFIEMLDQVKPAHLEYDFEYSYLLIKDIHERMTLAELEATTLDNLAF